MKKTTIAALSLMMASFGAFAADMPAAAPAATPAPAMDQKAMDACIATKTGVAADLAKAECMKEMNDKMMTDKEKNAPEMAH